eukprot:scaffold59183_cov23-Tisochrysis_lutea.AAC.2
MQKAVRLQSLVAHIACTTSNRVCHINIHTHTHTRTNTHHLCVPAVRLGATVWQSCLDLAQLLLQRPLLRQLLDRQHALQTRSAVFRVWGGQVYTGLLRGYGHQHALQEEYIEAWERHASYRPRFFKARFELDLMPMSDFLSCRGL